MNSLLLSATSINNLIIDFVIIAIVVLYFLWGFFKGFTKPLTGIISWGLIIVAVYFGGSFIGSLFMDAKYLNLDASIRPIIEYITSSTSAVVDVDKIMVYVGLILAALSITLVVKIIFAIINIFIKKARKPYKKSIWDRLAGAFLNLIKGAFVVCILLAIVVPIINIFEIKEIQPMITESAITKYIVQYNPITMLFNILIK